LLVLLKMLVEKKITIKNRLGLHARPASKFAQLASTFNCDITLVRDGKSVDGKSILEVLTLSCPKDTVLTIRAEGKDAKEAVSALKILVENGFGEMGL